MGGRISRTQRDLTVAAELRKRAKEEHFGYRWHPQGLARKLQDAYKVYAKFGGGRNLAMALDYDLEAECRRLGIRIDEVDQAVGRLVDFCVSKDTENDGFPAHLEGRSLEISELLKLFGNTQIDRFLRLKSAIQILNKMGKSLFFEGEPINALAGDKIELMYRLEQKGVSVEDLEGAVDFWNDGTITLDDTQGAYQLTDLMAALEELMG
jgi:hypothetical protein